MILTLKSTYSPNPSCQTRTESILLFFIHLCIQDNHARRLLWDEKPKQVNILMFEALLTSSYTRQCTLVHSSTLAWKIPWTEDLVGCSPWDCEESDMTERLHFHALEEEVAAHSSVLAWRIPGIPPGGGLPSMESHRVWHDWSDLAAAAAAAELQKQNEHEVISSWAKVFKFSSSKP